MHGGMAGTVEVPNYSFTRSMGSGGYYASGAGMLMLGVRIRKGMDDLSELEGVVAAYNTLTGYYKIAYIDGGTEELIQYQGEGRMQTRIMSYIATRSKNTRAGW